MKIKSLGHVALKVRDLNVAVAFYTKVLGLKEVARFEGKIVFFSIAGNHHDLALMETAPSAPSSPKDAPGLAHLAWKIGNSLDELRQAKKWLESQGSNLNGRQIIE